MSRRSIAIQPMLKVGVDCHERHAINPSRASRTVRHLPWAWFLVGVGVFILGAQICRWQMSLKVDGFGVASGVIFLAGGVWELLALQWPLAPILLILLGGYLLRKAVWH